MNIRRISAFLCLLLTLCIAQAMNKSKQQSDEAWQKMVREMDELAASSSSAASAAAAAASPASMASSAQVAQPQKGKYKLYIICDLLPANTAGKPIKWNDTIMSFATKLGSGASFVPDITSHISLLWYESRKPITQETITKLKRALNRANDILRIVYPGGVRGISLDDNATLLGKSRNVVAFKVHESEDFWKIMRIILKFIDYEEITGFKWSAFNDAGPLHVTLGRIMPSKLGKNYRDQAQSLSAPEGTRASQGEDFFISNFKLSYSEQDQDWQILESYIF